MKLCMFSPVEMVLERGWPGRIDGDTVTQLAAQSLQAFFTGGGQAREHATYALEDIVFGAPVLHPPSIRIFDDDEDFRFANPAAITVGGRTGSAPPGPKSVPVTDGGDRRRGRRIGGFTAFVEWTAPELSGEKSRDFQFGLGPIVTTPDEGAPPGVDWQRLVAHAAENTTLFPGDLIVR